MSFEKMKEPELRPVADAFGVDLQNCNTKQDIIAVLAEDGVTFEQWQALSAIQEVAPEKVLEASEAAGVITSRAQMAEEQVDAEVQEVVAAAKKAAVKRERRPDEVLVKMRRENPHYEIYGKTFTKEHPFVVCDTETAQAIFDADEDGFIPATPRELQEYYS